MFGWSLAALRRRSTLLLFLLGCSGRGALAPAHAAVLARDGGGGGGMRERITPGKAVRDLPTLAAFLDEYDANVFDGTGQTVTHWAASAGNVDAIDYAVGQRADVMRTDTDGRTPLHIAALSGHTEAVVRLLELRARGDARDIAGATPLYRAALAGSADALRALARAAPAAIDARFARTAGTALHAAVYLGHAPVLEALLEVGASPCLRNKDGELPIERFVEEDNDEVAVLAEEPPVVNKESRERVVDLLAARTAKCGGIF